MHAHCTRIPPVRVIMGMWRHSSTSFALTLENMHNSQIKLKTLNSYSTVEYFIWYGLKKNQNTKQAKLSDLVYCKINLTALQLTHLQQVLLVHKASYNSWWGSSTVTFLMIKKGPESEGRNTMLDHCGLCVEQRGLLPQLRPSATAEGQDSPPQP